MLPLEEKRLRKTLSCLLWLSLNARIWDSLLIDFFFSFSNILQPQDSAKSLWYFWFWCVKYFLDCCSEMGPLIINRAISSPLANADPCWTRQQCWCWIFQRGSKQPDPPSPPPPPPPSPPYSPSLPCHSFLQLLRLSNAALPCILTLL